MRTFFSLRTSHVTTRVAQVQGWRPALGPSKIWAPSFPCVLGIQIPFWNYRMNEGVHEIRVKNIKFRTLLIKSDHRCKIYLKTAGFFHIAHRHT